MKYEPHWDLTYHHVIWEAIEGGPLKVTPSDPEANKDIKLNRAQRRRLRRYIARKAKLQLLRLYKEHPGLRAVDIMDRKQHCNQCGQAFLGSSGDRCQCKVGQR